MRSWVWLGVLGLALATPVVAETLSEETGVNSVLGVAPKTEDFVTEAALSNLFEIQSSEIAKTKGDAQEMRFAGDMIADHQKITAELAALVEGGAAKTKLPTGLDSSHQSMIDNLNSASGEDFAKLYAHEQLAGHKAAVSLFERYAKGGDNPALKDWATKTITVLRQHLDMTKALRVNVTG